MRLLSNLETEAHKLLQIVLFGQTELDALLAQQAQRQIVQRISFAFRTEPLPLSLVGTYVGFRLQRCAITYRGMDVFAPAARNLLARRSGGWPRLINILADKAMLAASGWRQPQVSLAAMQAAVADCGHTNLSPAGLMERLWQCLARAA